jgi:hypothetical protein
MPNTSDCECSMRPIWWTDPDDANAWADKVDEINAWVKAHGVDPANVYSAAVVQHSDGSKQLHVREYLGCSSHAGYRYVDWTINQQATQLRVIPLLADPPDLTHP